MPRTTIASTLLLAALAVFALTGCEESGQAQVQDQAPPAPQVEIAEVAATAYSPAIELPGRISPVRVAHVRARVPGILLSRDFVEGCDVVKDQVLFHIDPAPYEAVYFQAKADQAKAEANLVDARNIANRYEPLVATGVISQQQYDTAIANLQVAQAAKRAAQAQVKTASLNLGYATVTAPISGRIGRAQVTEGALVGQGEATHLATIQQLDPIYADLTEPVAEFLKVRAAMQNDENGDGPKVTVEVPEVNFKQRGKLLFSDVTVDRTTGQVSLRCEFPNPEGVLLPDMFVRITITLGTEEEAIFVPQRAVTHAPDGSAQVFVVGTGGQAQARPIKTGKMHGSRWRVLEGLNPGENIVVNGVDKVRPGMPVKALSAEAETPAQG